MNIIIVSLKMNKDITLRILNALFEKITLISTLREIIYFIYLLDNNDGYI